ncbi:MAG TPA: beta-ketoacyl-ACP synthase II [Syntrophales bacterium]|nr:beta-ketoacyl-ACP synthase II [Syntrophales bacterium]HPX11430.1 beta-ketoacyl-ACP synthase II [Syntrophales bacterium]HQB31239.1 beta-ketoacyl-ACP synthase II [Syntrophales bacterium]HQN79161.1 beta-ketoacyl-ACP synthase II [Syntrophales bacterium]HQQ28147.1 beta-ketoacyl-ACP synthase II [Syntrophales bacterium]
MDPGKKRVVVTGLGTVNPLGNSVLDSWEAARSGKSGIGPITRFDASEFKTRIAGEVRDFDALAFVNAKELRRIDLFILYALASADMAVADAGLDHPEDLGDRTGVIIGTGIGGLSTTEKEKETLLSGGPKRISPFTIPAVLPNLAAGQVAIRHGARGPISCTVTACASGSNAVGDAFRAIADGYADVMIAGGSEAAVCPLTVAGFNAMRALSTRNDEPEKASRPFDRDRDGFVIGEGAGVLVLEELSRALDRRARIYAEIAGYATTSDAFHIAAPPPGHHGAVRAMELALRDARLLPADIDYINAHGTSTPLNDLYEVEAILKVFGDREDLAVSSTKSMTGHLLGAAGGVESVFTVLAVAGSVVPPTINLERPEKECRLDFVPHASRKRDVRAALSSSFGFGGVNAVLAFRKFEG